ncbi:sodium-dependent transporter [Haliovirga abyssi]|uniref:Transporter n=1 Tax=Haliovirga abyssi TaxID=2996794 RepID=A0AAU9DHI9_9FUSO|nr:sodium-dependent transporter [Haliovirga abyssi]BDU50204.1 transporter [Haliovirga abyssi]
MGEIKREGFANKIGAIAAIAGSAIGLGNIWRFPYMAGSNGGGAFLFVYLICIAILGFSVMMAEFILGRAAQRNVVGAYGKFGNKNWKIVGYIANITGFVLLSFYGIIGGWALKYIYLSITNSFSGKTSTQLGAIFSSFIGKGMQPLFWYILFMALTAIIILSGVQKGIEKASEIMMPLLFGIIIILAVRALFLPGAKEGLKFLFAVDFSKITGKVILSALGHSFFTLSLGMGTMVIYGSYIKEKTKLENVALQVIIADTLVAILAGIVIFPAIFTFGINPAGGPGLAFITLPNVFLKITGGYFIAILFFALLSIAALTSSISILEVLVAYFVEEKNIDRKKATIVTTIVMIMVGIPASLSLNPSRHLIFGGKSIFDWFDFFTGTLMLPVGGLFVSIFVGWFLDKNIIKKELKDNQLLMKFLSFTLKFIAPITVFIVLINGLGIIK